jgi:hypothetical protein
MPLVFHSAVLQFCSNVEGQWVHAIEPRVDTCMIPRFSERMLLPLHRETRHTDPNADSDHAIPAQPRGVPLVLVASESVPES